MRKFKQKGSAIIHGQSTCLNGRNDFCHNQTQKDLYIEASRLLRASKKKKRNKMNPSGNSSVQSRTRGSCNDQGTP